MSERSRRGRLVARERPGRLASSRSGVKRIGTAGVLGAVGVLLLLAGLLLLVAGWHLTQGTSGVGVSASCGRWPPETRDATTESTRQILVGSRIPRLAAGIAVGFALGIAGALLQSLTRNSLASPDTLAVTAGSYLAVVAVAAFGLSIPLWASGGVAFVGGLTAAALVLGLSGARHVDDPGAAGRFGGGAGPAVGDGDPAHPVQPEHDQPVRLGQRLAEPARPHRVPVRGPGGASRPWWPACCWPAGST